MLVISCAAHLLDTFLFSFSEQLPSLGPRFHSSFLQNCRRTDFRFPKTLGRYAVQDMYSSSLPVFRLLSLIHQPTHSFVFAVFFRIAATQLFG
jgi:hypothetical protein